MGLTIYYNLDLPGDASEDAARDIVTALANAARVRGVERVSPIQHIDSTKVGPPPNGRIDLDWLVRCTATAGVEHPDEADRFLSVRPEVGFGFGVVVGRCEGMTLGLARYPAVVTANGAEIPTRLRSWRWHSCTKTQYAGLHGTEHFLACHRAVIGLLDAAAALGVAVDVRDDSGYWEHRDEQRLLASLDEWNRLVARVAGGLADAIDRADVKAMAPIFQNPDFERLEME